MFTDRGSFIEGQSALRSFVSNIDKLTAALGQPEAVSPLHNHLLDTTTQIAEELLQSGYSPDLLYPTLGCLSATLGRLAYMNGTRTLELDGLITQDDLITNPNAPQDLAALRQRFPNTATCHQIIALEHAVREIFSQWQSGATFAELAEQLSLYYANFSYDIQTTQKYTDHDTLITNAVSSLNEQLRAHPLAPGAKITIIGPGPNPPELDIIRALIASGNLQSFQIDGVDLQTAATLGLDLHKLPQNYHFHGGYSLADWGRLVEQNPERQADLVFFFGSVNNNDPNYFQHVLDFLALARSLKHKGLLVYDTASLEDSPSHLAASVEHHQSHPHAAVGERKSAQVQDATAHIFPNYLIQLYLDLANITIVNHNIWQVDPGRARHLIIAQKKQDQVSVFGQLLESLIPRSFDLPASLRRPSPAALATASS